MNSSLFSVAARKVGYFVLLTSICHGKGKTLLHTSGLADVGRFCCCLLSLLKGYIIFQCIPHPVNGVVDTLLGTFLRGGMLRTS